MGIERIYQKTERTPEEKARIQAIREKFQREKPSLEELLASGEYDGPVPQGAYRELRVLMTTLKAARERQGLSLAEVARQCRIDKAALSRLETGRQINPTIDTLWRYAHAVGKQLAWVTTDDEQPLKDADGRRQPRPKQARPKSTTATSTQKGGSKKRAAAGANKKAAKG